MRKILLAIALLSCFGCNRYLNPSMMFKTPKDFQYTVDQTIGNIEYRIAPNDIISFDVYSNDGFKLIEQTVAVSTAGSASQIGVQTEESVIEYSVDIDGFVKLPTIGRFKIKDLTVREAELALEKQYEVYYKKPFVMIRVTNRRVMVFTGKGGEGKVVNLKNENTSLIEALAEAGGIQETGKAYKVKLIRGDYKNPQVQLIDLSTVEGMKQSNLLLQANDIIYVEPKPQTSQGIFAELAPIVGIITSIALVYVILNPNK